MGLCDDDFDEDTEVSPEAAILIFNDCVRTCEYALYKGDQGLEYSDCIGDTTSEFDEFFNFAVHAHDFKQVSSFQVLKVLQRRAPWGEEQFPQFENSSFRGDPVYAVYNPVHQRYQTFHNQALAMKTYYELPDPADLLEEYNFQAYSGMIGQVLAHVTTSLNSPRQVWNWANPNHEGSDQ